MPPPGNARGLTLAALAAAVVAASFTAFGMRPDGIASYYRDRLTPAGFALWAAGLIVATLSPPAVAVAFWLRARKTRYGWLLHLLLVPVTYALVQGAVAIMLMVAGEPDSDGPTGWATDPAAMLMLLCPVAYFAACGLRTLRGRSAGQSSTPSNIGSTDTKI